MTTVERGRQVLDDRYELGELIAVGGMGEVWRGRDTRLGRDVAVKLLRSEYAGDPTFLARFRREATHAAALSHPNIAAVHDYGESTCADTGEHVAYLVMELVEGDPLSARLSDGPLDTDTALEVLRQAAAGLAEAHRAGVVHRDVKPANILIRPDGRVKLTDFGIASSAAGVPLTETGQLVGTPQYLAPERAMGEPAVPASDVYALGLVGYESLTGHPAFTGDNPVSVALKQVQEAPEPLPEELPPDVRHLIDAALSKDPEERIPDGGAFVAAIDETREAPSTVEIALGGDTRPVAAVRRQRRRLPATAVVLAGLLLCALVAGGVLLAGGGPGERGSAAELAAPTAGGIVLAADEYVGRPADAVVAELTSLGLRVQREDRVDPAHEAGTVTALTPGGDVVPGQQVQVTVAVAPPVEAADIGTPTSTEAPVPVDTRSGGTAVYDRVPAAPAEATTDAPAPAASTTQADDGTADPGVADAGTTDPGTTDPATTDPTTTDPATTDPATTDGGTTASTPAETSASVSDAGPTG